MGMENLPVSRTWVMPDGTVHEQRLESYQIDCVIDVAMTREQAEPRVRGLLATGVAQNGGTELLGVEILWREKGVLAIDRDGHSEAHAVVGIAYCFPRMEF